MLEEAGKLPGIMLISLARHRRPVDSFVQFRSDMLIQTTLVNSKNVVWWRVTCLGFVSLYQRLSDLPGASGSIQGTILTWHSSKIIILHYNGTNAFYTLPLMPLMLLLPIDV